MKRLAGVVLLLCACSDDGAAFKPLIEAEQKRIDELRPSALEAQERARANQGDLKKALAAFAARPWPELTDDKLQALLRDAGNRAAAKLEVIKAIRSAGAVELELQVSPPSRVHAAAAALLSLGADEPAFTLRAAAPGLLTAVAPLRPVPPRGEGPPPAPPGEEPPARTQLEQQLKARLGELRAERTRLEQYLADVPLQGDWNAYVKTAVDQARSVTTLHDRQLLAARALAAASALPQRVGYEDSGLIRLAYKSEPQAENAVGDPKLAIPGTVIKLKESELHLVPVKAP